MRKSNLIAVLTSTFTFLHLPGASASKVSEPTNPEALAFAISAPRPEHPYDARRGRITGTGIAEIDVDPASGDVRAVRMNPSTGSAILDNAALSAFRKWRFKPGTVRRVRTPITFTMSGYVTTEIQVKQKPMDDVLSAFLGKGTVFKGPIPAYPRWPPWDVKQGRGVYELHVAKDGKVGEVKILKILETRPSIGWPLELCANGDSAGVHLSSNYRSALPSRLRITPSKSRAHIKLQACGAA